jgi:glycosyltransferase involved in cell wall biosynthesis
MTPQPEITVAVSTKGRAQRLPRLIEALEAQTLARERFEVVIVDNGSADDTTPVLASIADRSPLALTHVRLEGSNGPAVGRNAAWRAGRAPIVAFTDDDCYPTPEWLASGLEAMEKSGVVVGRTLPDPAQSHLLGPFARTMRVEDARFFQTCNIFFRRDDLAAVGGFDEAFPTPAGEDTDLGFRVKDLGRTVAFSPEAAVFHDVSPSSVRDTARVTLRWGGLARVVKKHPKDSRRLLYKRLFWKRSHPPAILAAFGLVLGAVFPLALLLTIPWLKLRLVAQPLSRGRLGRFLVLPGAFAIDLLEVYVMARGSLEHRTLIL